MIFQLLFSHFQTTSQETYTEKRGLKSVSSNEE